MAPINERNKLLGFNKSYAFIIGINKYPFINGNLTSAIPDARRLSSILKEGQGFEHVELLEDIDGATFRSLLERIKNPALEPIITENDSIVFYYAGHGKPGEFDEGPAGYVLPSDAKPSHAQLENASLIPMEDIFDTLKAVNCRHTFLILDCCFAGKFRHVGVKSRNTRRLTRVPLYPERFERYKTRKAWQVLVSAGPDQTAADWMGDRDDANEDSVHSPFARALFEALEGEADLKQKGKNLGDGVLTSNELFIYLWDKVERATKKNPRFKTQHPDLFPMGNHEGGEFIFFDPKNALNFAVRKKRNPYKGLKAFEPEDHDLFFGRKKQVEKVLEKLKHTNILIISAPSGFGKTSFVNAGIYPQLKEKYHTELITFRPESQPKKEWDALNFKPANSSEQLLFIDQFEQVYTKCEDLKEANAFDLTLKDFIFENRRSRNQKLKIIITIRSDFEWQFEASEASHVFWTKEDKLKVFYRLPPMVLDELREAILQPALVETYDFESEELLNLILEEVSYAPGALPLMSFGMKSFVDITDKDKRIFTTDNYKNKLEGISGALSKKADVIYNELKSDDHKNTMRKIMLRMVSLKDGAYVRRRVPVTSIGQNAPEFLHELDYPEDKEDAMIREVLTKLIDSGLIIRGSDHLHQPYVEPIHDALINFWPRCLKWIQEFGDENIVLQRQLWSAVKKYLKSKKSSYHLWDDDPRLEPLYKLTQSFFDQKNWFNAAELEFILNSRATYLGELERIKRERDEARANVLAANAMLAYPKDNTQGLQYAIKAYQKYPTEEAAKALHDILSNPQSQFSSILGNPAFSFGMKSAPGGMVSFGLIESYTPIFAFAMTPNGKNICSAHSDGVIRFWGHPFEKPLKSLRTNTGVNSLACSGNNKLLYAGGSENATIIEIETGETLAELGSTDYGGFEKGKFVHGDKILMIELKNGGIAIWEFMANPKSLSTVLTNYLIPVKAFGLSSTADPRYYVYYENMSYKTWNLKFDQMVIRSLIKPNPNAYGFSESDESLVAASLSHDCHKFVTYHSDGRLSFRFTDEENPKPIDSEYGLFEFTGVDQVKGFHFSYDDELLIGFAENGPAVVWEASSGKNLYLIENNYGQIKDAICNLKSKDGTIAVATFDRIHVWVMTGQQLTTSKDAIENLLPKEKKAPAQEEINIIQNFNSMFKEEIDPIRNQHTIVSPDHNHVVAIKSDHSIESWEVVKNENITFKKIHAMTGHQSDINDTLFDHKGYLISTSRDGTTRVWDIKEGRLLWTIRTDACEKLNLSDDGTVIFITGINDKVEIVQHLLSSKG